jgi:hypothetical protein
MDAISWQIVVTQFLGTGVVRNEPELNFIREYIRTNAANWESDRLYESDTRA